MADANNNTPPPWWSEPSVAAPAIAYALAKGAKTALPYVQKAGSIGLRWGKGLGIGSLTGLFGSLANPSDPGIAAQLANARAGGINRPPGGVFGTGAGYGVSPNPVAQPPAAPTTGFAAPTAPPTGLDLSPASLAQHQPWMNGASAVPMSPAGSAGAPANVPLPPPRPTPQLGPVNTAPPQMPQWGQGDILAAMNGPPPQQSPFASNSDTQGPSLISKFMNALLSRPVSHDQQSSGYQS